MNWFSRSNQRPGHLLLFLNSIFLSLIPGFFCSAVVTLESIEIFKTHEWFPAKPIVYFACRGENHSILPDVKNINFLYTFKEEESWQPLTEFTARKCKRCGFYNKDTLTTDDVFDEWELCPSDFESPDGKYIRVKEKEFNATFVCPKCIPLSRGPGADSHEREKERRTDNALVIVSIVLVLVLSGLGVVAAYRYWKRRKRELDQARFLKLFEEGDDIDEEMGLDHHGI